MSTVVCTTTFEHIPAHKSGHRYWPSTSTERSSRPPALRIHTSEVTPSAANVSKPMGPAAASSSREHPSDPMRQQARPSNDGPAPALPFPSSRTSPHPSRPRPSSSAEPATNAHQTDPCARPRPRRTRAASSATIAATPRSRPRIPSLLSSVLTPHKSPVAEPRPCAHDPDLVGSFTPTSSPRPRLQSLLSGLPLAPSFSTPSSPQPSPPSSRHGTLPRSRSRHPHPSDAPFTPSSPIPSPPNDADAPLPSICRTPSSCPGSDYFPTAPSSAGPATPVHPTSALPAASPEHTHTHPTRSPPSLSLSLSKAPALTLHPVLESLERTSMFRVQTACATCGRHGSNFPCCPKCGEMWCSRACRLRKGDGKRHVCAAAKRSVAAA